MKKMLRTAISLTLAFVMTLQLFPASILATEEESTSPTAGLSDEVRQTDAKALAYEEEAQPTRILFEEESLRGENVKQFRMDDGSYVAVQYDTPVHYMDENGQWQDIDNTLCLDAASAARAYTAVNGDGSVSFAASLRDEAVLTTSSGSHSVQLFLYGTSDEAVEEPLPVDEPLQPGITAEADEAQTNAAESEIALPAEVALPNEAASEAEPETPPEANAQDAEYAPSISEAAESPEEPLATYHEATAEILESSALFSTQQEASFLPATLSTSLLYENVYDGVDLKYDVYGYNIKESILVNQPLASYTFSFVLHTGDLSAVMQEDGSILLADAEEAPVYGIPAPYMLDAAGSYSDAVCYTLEAIEEGSYLLRVEADADWIAEAQFPVAIDPTIFKLSSSTPLSWGCIFSGLPNNTYSGTNPMVGYTALDNGGEYQLITHVNTLPSLPAGSIVTNARINIRHASFSNDSSDNYMLVEAHKLTIDKSAGQTYDAWLQSMTWNSVHPGGAQNYDDNVEDFMKLTPSTEGTYVQLDITKAVRGWYQNAAQNRTLLFKSDCTANKKIISTFYTPGSNTYFAVTYRNDFGLEDYYTYRSQSAGRAGTGYISDHMQRLTLVDPIISSGSNVMPFSLSLVYNSALNRSYFGAASDSYTRDYRNMLLGAGWKLSAQQCVQSVRISGDDANTLYWVYTDGDGTQHYFYETSNGVYEDEDGLGLKITLDEETGHTNFKMTDDYGNETYFRDGILTYTKDAYGNGIYYCYNGSAFDNASSTTWRPTNAVYNRLTAIYRLNNGGTSEKLVEFTYDSNNRITEIKDEAQRITRLYYNTSDSTDYLDYIVYPDGAKADYTYGSSGMSGAYDEEANYGIWYVYHTDGTVDEFYEYYLNGTAHVVGNVVSCWNGLNRSSYRDWGADHQKETSDDLRLEVVFDNWGRTVCSYTTNYNNTKILGSAALSYTANSGTNRKNNRITSVGSSGMTAVNLLPDGSMEYDSAGNWTNLSTGSSSAAVRDTENGQIARNGTWGLKFWISGSAAATDTAALCHSAVYLTAGKDYTFSGYFKTGAEMTWGSAAELRIKFLDSSGEAVWNEIVATAKPGAQINGGWQRVSATFPVETSGYYRPGFWLSGCTDLAFIDDVQLEESEAASSYNLVQNGSFESGSNGWSWGSLASTETYSATPFGAKALRMTGSQNATNRASRTIPLHCSSDTTFLLSGWAKGYSAPNPAAELGSTSRYFGLSLRIDYSDGTNELHSVPFAWASNDWQCTVGTIVPKKSGTTIDKIVVYCAYDFNSGYALFDNISLRQEPVQTYAYNEKGNVYAVTQSDIAAEQGEYDANGVDLISYTASNGVQYTYAYNDQHDVTTESYDGLTTTLTYDAFGNVTQRRTSASGAKDMQSQSTITADGNHTASVTDVNGSTTTYTYDPAKELCYAVTNAKNVTTTYAHNNQNDRPYQTYQNGVAAITYGYDRGMLSTLTRKTFTSPGSDTPYWQRYSFPTNDWGQRTAVTVSRSTDGTNWTSRTLASYEYEANNGNLKKLTYANGDSVSYEYDLFDRLTRTVYNDTGNYIAYAYTAEGALAKVTYGTSAGQILAVYTFEYDSLGRLIRSRQTEGQNTVQQTEHLYDTANRLSAQNWTIGTQSFSESYAYRSNDGKLSSMAAATGDTLTYSYDPLKRLNGVTTKNASGTRLFYTTLSYAVNGNQSTDRISSISYKNNSNGTIAYYGYAYDALGNITKIYGTNSRELASYTYDTQNQLTQEVRKTYDEGSTTPSSTVTVNYTYDTAGNISGAAGDGKTISYFYENASWLDLLTAVEVNGTKKSISYDSSGNPGNWYNGTTYSNLKWTQGRCLSSLKKGLTNISYAYDLNGIRTTKIVGRVKYEYVTQNGKVVRELVTNATTNAFIRCMDFIYDESGRPFAMRNYWNSSLSGYDTYHYILNAQGDVVQITYQGGTVKATYTYDAWGQVLTATGDLAAINPLRYRGYYYDTETGFYYLQSRYYDPANHRFINADSFASTGQGIIGTNTFAYCGNNPVCGIDPEGARYRPYSVTYTDVGSTYILDQEDLLVDELPFGYSTIGRSGCGAVATFNALISLGNKKSMWDLICYFNNEADLVLGGRAGVLPEEVGKYFSNSGYTVVITDEPVLMDALAQTADACILWYLYETDSFPYFGGHFVEFSRTNTGYIGRNTANGVTFFDYPSDYAYDYRRFYAKAIFVFK